MPTNESPLWAQGVELNANCHLLTVKKGASMKRNLAIVVAFVWSLSLLAAAQEKAPASPPAHAECKFSDGKTLKVDYSSPRMRGRKIYGGLVPYGQVWRTGANAATSGELVSCCNPEACRVQAVGSTTMVAPRA